MASLAHSNGHHNGHNGHHRRRLDAAQTIRLGGDFNAAKALRTEALATIRAERAEIYRTARQLGISPGLLRLLSRV